MRAAFDGHVSTRVLIADDQELVRAGLRMILDRVEDFEIVGEATDGREAVDLARARMPDVVLMDVRMPGVDGIEATRRLSQSTVFEDVRVLVLTTFDLDKYVYAALRAGASAFLLKDTPPAELVHAIRIVASGDALLAPSVTRRLINAFAETSADDAVDVDLASLTAREREVLKLVAQGLSNAEIASTLVLEESTVKTHVRHVLQKLCLRDRVQAVVAAYEGGLVRARGS
jgi:DNA-binding NarL/FixJ family response regulator